MVVLIGVWQQMFTFYDVNHFARLMFIIHIVAAVVVVVVAAGTTWKGHACNIIRPLGSLQTVHTVLFLLVNRNKTGEKNRNNLSLCWAINLIVNWVRCRCDKYLAHSWGIVQKMRYASCIEEYMKVNHIKGSAFRSFCSRFFSFCLSPGHLLCGVLSLRWSFFFWCC